MKKQILLLLMLSSVLGSLLAQRNCGSMDYLQEQLNQYPEQEEKMLEIERFTERFAQDGGARMVLTIPVVFHVVYNNSAENISDAQIHSQLAVLNEDFRRTNSDANNDWSQAADVEIEFCLATTDPSGNSTTGITRTSTSKRSFRTNDDVKKSNKGGISPWNTADYLNIWVCDISNGILGYAQFPGGSAATDGVVLDYAYTGRGGSAAAPFDLGRTATHEVGHYLNLRHIWGDGGCSVDDFVADTPTSDGANYGCATGHVSCSSVDMVENYMDYSDDACMNLFTADQTARMRALFAAGGARESLLNSGGCGGTPPTPTCNDGIQNGDEEGVDCGGSVCNACPPPAACDAATNLSSTSRKRGREAILAWDAAASANSYTIELRQVNGSWSSATSTSTSITATGLTRNVSYEWRVTSHCSGGETAVTAIHSFIAGQNSRLTGDAQELLVYPNPTQSMLYIDLDNLDVEQTASSGLQFTQGETIIARVYDASGKVLLQKQVVDNGQLIELNVSNVAQGLYFLRLQSSTGYDYGTTRFIVSK